MAVIQAIFTLAPFIYYLLNTTWWVSVKGIFKS